MPIPALKNRLIIRLEQIDEIAKRFEFVRRLGESEKIVEDDEVAALKVGLHTDQRDQGSIVEVDINME